MSDKFKFSEEDRIEIENLAYDVYNLGSDNIIDRIEQIIQDRGNSIQDGASAEDVVKATLMGYVDPNKVAKISGELMRVFQSETAKVVAGKDREISEVKQAYNAFGDLYDIQADRISTSNAHRTRLIESVKKWGGAWRTCRAELKEAKERIKELEEQIQHNTDGTY